MLRGFELVYGLKVDFYKSKLYGLNTSDHFLEGTSQFLFCYIDKLPLNFLGIMVGSNPRRVSPWSGVIDKMRNKLAVWKGKFISIG